MKRQQAITATVLSAIKAKSGRITNQNIRRDCAITKDQVHTAIAALLYNRLIHVSGHEPRVAHGGTPLCLYAVGPKPVQGIRDTIKSLPPLEQLMLKWEPQWPQQQETQP